MKRDIVDLWIAVDTMPAKENPTSSLRVAVILPLNETFLYRVPDYLLARAKVGCRVQVPVKNRSVLGYVLEVVKEEQDRELKGIHKVLDEAPLFHEGLVPLFQWMADYYCYPIGRLIRAALPSGINQATYNSARITERGEEALRLLSPQSLEREILGWVKSNPGKKLPYPTDRVLRLEKRGWLIVEEKQSRHKVAPLKRILVRPREKAVLERLLRDRGQALKARNEQAFLETVLESGGVPLRELTSRFTNGQYLVRKWSEKGVLERHPVTLFRDPAGNLLSPPPVPAELYDQQRRALEGIRDNLRRGAFRTCLLHGVTGSGKTEVYYRAIRHAMDLGKQALFMVPEIALAVYLEGIFRSRLGERIAILHSDLSEGERYDQWMRITRGEVDLVIGARSAIFAPLPRLGLIIVDEEHDGSYKQEEAPRYQARDVAVIRGRQEGALVLLGSGTPSVQSYYNAVTGKYQLLTMPERVEQRPMPSVRFVDMKDVATDGDAIISPALREALDKTLETGNQIIIFLNRRGFNRIYLCGQCGKALRCRNCDVALTHHLRGNRLMCHYCGYRIQSPERCPNCNAEGLKAYGFGTEKLEQRLKELYPDKVIARMDRDSVRRKGEAFRILKRFRRQEVDIIVGTQMITKGYDFPNVTLVGIVAADLSLGFPDFRAGERTFQILAQAAGRTGRGEQGGAVIVQTFNPDHYAIATAKDHDYESFFQREIDLRKQLRYPPFSHLACIRFQGNSKGATERATHLVSQELMEILGKWRKGGDEVQVLGPAESPLSRLKGKYRWQILIKSKAPGLRNHLLKGIERSSKSILRSTGVSMMIDVDPYHMM
ncbi:MAG: primosomal protein N' [Deltaproteobacteria bacterium]|nr:primosomal protein N' [Deltaproteobacteria bacterium]